MSLSDGFREALASNVSRVYQTYPLPETEPLAGENVTMPQPMLSLPVQPQLPLPVQQPIPMPIQMSQPLPVYIPPPIEVHTGRKRNLWIIPLIGSAVASLTSLLFALK